jgi:myo-inositol-1-phosphate synthase
VSSAQRTGGGLGVWLVGAGGNVAVTVAAGMAALRLGAADSIGLCTETMPLKKHAFADFSDCVVGGHEIREADPRGVFARLSDVDRALPPELREIVQGDLDHYQRRVVPGADRGASLPKLRDDLQQFVQEHGLKHLVVVNVATTEAIGDALPTTEAELRHAVESDKVPMSTVYALAAMDAGASYVNFTPSTGSKGDVFNRLAEERGLIHAGRDGKTGETLLKAALLPMFAARNLRVESWFGQNILGNEDGRSLQEEGRKTSKRESKGGMVENILGYQPAAHVGIDYVEPLGDWKVAWDHVLFRGFLGTRMNLQLTWQGADSVLAAPLVIDLARIVGFCQERGDAGLIPHLGFFFKEPLGSEEHGLMAQYQALIDFLDKPTEAAK